MWLTPYTDQARREQTLMARQARLRGDYAKTQATKTQIIHILDAEPGLTAEQIANRIEKTPEYIRVMLRRLYKDEKVDTWKVKSGTHSWVQKWITK